MMQQDKFSVLNFSNIMPQILIVVTKLDSNLEVVFHNDVSNALP